jgi:hypothetical protein
MYAQSTAKSFSCMEHLRACSGAGFGAAAICGSISRTGTSPHRHGCCHGNSLHEYHGTTA